MLAPILLFVYSRLEHLKKTIQSLQSNELSKESDLVIYSDAPANELHCAGVEKVRRYIKGVVGFKSIQIYYQNNNVGLSNSIISGVSCVLRSFDKVIVLEDDLVVSPYFLSFMNSALEKYAQTNNVASVHGYVYPCKDRLPSTFFLRGADCWGWGTWARAWDKFNPNGQSLLNDIKRGKLDRYFDFDGSYPFTKMLEDQIQGKNDSWAIRWNASIFLRNELTLYPGISLVENIGNDGSGTHRSNESLYAVRLADRPVKVGDIPIEESVAARKAFIKYFRMQHSSWIKKIRSKLKRICDRLIK